MLPGPAVFVELAPRAGPIQVDSWGGRGADGGDLLVLPTVGGVQLQVVVGVGEMGQRPVSIYSRNAESVPGGCCMPGAYWGQRRLPRQRICRCGRRWVLPRLMSMAPISDSPNWAEYGPGVSGLTAMWRRDQGSSPMLPSPTMSM